MLGTVSVMGAIIWVGCVRFFYCDDRKGYRPHGNGSGVPLQLIPTSCRRSCTQAAVDAYRVASQFFTIFLGRGLLVFRSALKVHLQHEGPSQTHSRKHSQKILWNQVLQRCASMLLVLCC
jgi:hypothetical protein